MSRFSNPLWGGIRLLKELQELVIIHPEDILNVMDIRNRFRDACGHEKVLSVIFLDCRMWEHEELLEENWDEYPQILLKSIKTPHFDKVDESEHGIIQDWVVNKIVGGEELVC